MDESQRVGRRLRDARVWRGFTRAYVCEKIGKDTATLFRYETGASEPSFAMLKRLCRLYGVTMAQVVDPKNAKNAA